MSEESKFAFQREKGIEAGTVAAKSFAALCANADALRLGAWLAIVKNNLESAKAVMRAKECRQGRSQHGKTRFFPSSRRPSSARSGALKRSRFSPRSVYRLPKSTRRPARRQKRSRRIFAW